jgi:oligopeptide/dipeptide ABC transporter ATP-binding protein
VTTQGSLTFGMRSEQATSLVRAEDAAPLLGTPCPNQGERSSPLVDIQDLTVDYASRGGLLGQHKRHLRIIENLNLQILSGETLGVVGESGCGKTTLANSLLRFIRPTSGRVLFEGRDILALDRASMRQLRREIQMVFQNPYSSLDPRQTVLAIVGEPLITHTKLRGKALAERVEQLLMEVGLNAELLQRHPHEMSGGQAQRVALARALALNPKFIILDEPTSALDVSVQAQIINLLGELQRQHRLTYMVISHSLGVIQHVSDRIAVLYLGEVVELATVNEITCSPKHPYTQALFSSTPVPDPDGNRERIILQGQVPSPTDPPPGCRFHTRCPYVMDRCRSEKPVAHILGNGHWARCHLLDAGHI